MEENIIKELHSIASDIKEPEWRFSALLWVGQAYAAAGMKDKAIHTFREAAAVARTEEQWKDLGILASAWRAAMIGALEDTNDLLKEFFSLFKKRIGEQSEGELNDFLVDGSYELQVYISELCDALGTPTSANMKEIGKCVAEIFKQNFFIFTSDPLTKFFKEVGKAAIDEYEYKMLLLSIIDFCLNHLGVEPVLELARGVEDKEVRSEAFKEIAVRLAEMGKYEEAKAVADEGIRYIDHAISADGAIAKAMVKGGEKERAMSILEELYEEVEKLYEEHKESEDLQYLTKNLLKITKNMVEIGERTRALAKMGRIYEFVKKIEKPSERSYQLAEIAIDMAEAGEMKESAKILEEAISIAQGGGEEYERSKGINELIETVSEKKDYEIVLQIARNMEKLGSRARALLGIAQIFIKGKEKEKALDILKEARETARVIKEETERSRMLSIIAESMAELGELEEAEWIANNIDDELEQANILLTIASLWEKRGESDEALRLSEKALKITKAFSLPELSWELHSKIAPALARGGRYEEAMKIARGIEENYYKATALLGIVEALLRAGDITGALEILYEAENITRCTGPLEITEEADDIMRYLRKPEPRDALLADIALSLNKAGLVEKSLQLLSMLDSAQLRVDTIEQMVDYRIKKGDWETAIQIAEQCSHPQKQAELLRRISISLERVGRKEEAKELWRKGRNIEMIRGKEIDKGIWVELCPYGTCTCFFPFYYEHCLDPEAWRISQIAKEGNFLEAFKELKELESDESKASAIMWIAEWLSEKFKEKRLGVFDEALEVAKELEDDFVRSSALMRLSSIFLRVGAYDEVRQICLEMPDVTRRAELLVQLASALARAEKMDEARKTIDEALLEVRKIEAPFDRSRVLLEIGKFLLECGEVDEALDISREIEYEDERIDLLIDIMRSMVRQGRIESALDLARSLENKFRQAEALAIIGETMLEIEKKD
ncbi:hypothetical protein H5T87_02480 [bacterium]|nr:hypothetical protein [bacterium]